MNSSLITSFVRRDKGMSDLDIWVALEQAYVPDTAKAATLKDVYAMKAMARSGRSAMEYVYDECPYARIRDGVMTVKLDFYVWASSLDLPYQLKSGQGIISSAGRFDRPRKFNVIFKNSASENLGFLFDGTFTPEMPFFNNVGQIIFPPPEITISGSNLQLSEPATCSLRAHCTAHGYRHTLTMELGKSTVTIKGAKPGDEIKIYGYGYALDKLQTDITALWIDANGETQSVILPMDIPGCIEDMISACGGEKLIVNKKDDEDKPSYVVYYSTCNGEILDEFWRDPQ